MTRSQFHTPHTTQQIQRVVAAAVATGPQMGTMHWFGQLTPVAIDALAYEALEMLMYQHAQQQQRPAA